MTARTLDLITTHTTSASPGAVWRVFADAARWPERIGVVAEVMHVPAAWAAGERLAFRLRVAGVGIPFDVRLDEVVPEVLVRWSSVRWSVTGTRTWTFAAHGPGTVVTDHKRFEHPVAPLRWVYPRAPIVAMSEAWLRDLAAAAETTG